MPTLSHLILYPIKSCAAMPVEEALATTAGLCAHGVHDREWMLVTNEGQFLTQREFPRMATVTPRVDGDTLVVSAPGMPPLRLPLTAQPQDRTMRVQIWDDLVDAIDCGDDSAGVPTRHGHVLATDQAGTVLGDYLVARAAKGGDQ